MTSPSGCGASGARMHLPTAAALRSLPRLVFASGLAAAALSAHSLYWQLMLIMLAMLCVRLLDGGWRSVRRLASLLQWFLIPILLFHLLLSPGERLFPGSGLPLSVDGLRLGLFLSLRLALFFLVAMTISRLWRRDEWLYYAARLPAVGERIYPYLLCLAPLAASVQAELRRYRSLWRLRSDWRRLGEMLYALIRHALARSAPQARQLWLRWPASPVLLHGDGNAPAGGRRAMEILLVVMGVSGWVLLWMH